MLGKHPAVCVVLVGAIMLSGCSEELSDCSEEGSHGTGWTYIDREGIFFELYVHFRSIEYEGPYRRAWALHSQITDYFDEFNSIRSLVECDCTRNGIRTLTQENYSGHHLTGRLVGIEDVPTEWSFESPDDSINGAILSAVCKHSRVRPTPSVLNSGISSLKQ